MLIANPQDQSKEAFDFEKNYARITDPDNLKKARKASEAKAAEFTVEEWKKLRVLCKKNLFFLSHTVLNYNKLSPNLHGSVCLWYDSVVKKEQHSLLLLPRSHFKSTIYTISGTIQAHLPDDSNNEPWPYCLGTDGRTIIFHEIHEMAAKFLFSITQHFLTNPFLMGLFPECVPDPKRNRINKYQLELPRKEIWGEPTVDTLGAGARGQGNHYNILKLDDIIGAEARDSPTQMQTNKDWVDNIQSFYVSITEDKLNVAGTRWAFDDTYGHLINNYGDELHKYIRAVEEPDPKTGELKPIFPEQFTTKSLNILRKNVKVWTAQYLNNPAAAATGIDTTKLKYFKWAGPKTISYYDSLAASYPGDPTAIRQVHTDDLDIVFLIDPGTTKSFALTITGIDKHFRIFLLEAIKGAMKPEAQTDLVFKKVLQWNPRLVCPESVLFSALYEPYWIAEQALRRIKFAIEPLKVGRDEKSKEVRIMGLSQYINAGQLFINELQTNFLTECQQFGVSQDIHLLDSLSMGPRVWRVATVKRSEEEMNNNSNLANRDGSGYTAIKYAKR